jgi:hypothetical protein
LSEIDLNRWLGGWGATLWCRKTPVDEKLAEVQAEISTIREIRSGGTWSLFCRNLNGDVLAEEVMHAGPMVGNVVGLMG